eukprot:TRINITY_DN18850_c0_g1_i2.p1 TRINITY_DN18850_c0_g1~~TRINITY_DN18850_c0_g1_i2.p1  ORF type:complete len:321 (+),score=72.07 TRINITY_DN18850_c0_g1_i2:163-1125(+)
MRSRQLHVSIPSTSTQEDNAVFYHIHSTYGGHKVGQVSRRYNQFEALAMALSELGVQPPAMPEKRMFGNTSPQVVQLRKAAFERFLNNLVGLAYQVRNEKDMSAVWAFLDIPKPWGLHHSRPQAINNTQGADAKNATAVITRARSGSAMIGSLPASGLMVGSSLPSPGMMANAGRMKDEDIDRETEGNSATPELAQSFGQGGSWANSGQVMLPDLRGSNNLRGSSVVASSLQRGMSMHESSPQPQSTSKMSSSSVAGRSITRAGSSYAEGPSGSSPLASSWQNQAKQAIAKCELPVMSQEHNDLYPVSYTHLTLPTKRIV